MITYLWIRRGQELIFDLPVSSKFAILHVDLWILGHHVGSNGYMAFVNVMCGMSQFVVVVPGSDKCSTILASYYIQYVLLKFGLCHLVLLDDDTLSK